jgi:hypothetical protein
MLRNVRKSTLDIIETYILLVYYGFKDSYLVDCCMLTSAEAVQVVHSVYDRYSLPHDVELLVVMLKDDVFISNVNALGAKQQQLRITGDAAGDLEIRLPVIVDVHRGICSVAVDEVALAIYQQLQNLLTHSCTAQCLIRTFEVATAEIVSSPLLAGWLLGYPCLYQSHGGSSSEHNADSSLSMMELTLFSIRCNVAVYCSLANDNKTTKKKSETKGSTITPQPTQHYADLDLLSFSVPQSILQEGNVERRVVELTNSIVERMKVVAASMAEAKDKMVEVTDIRLEVTTCTVPSIVL